MLLSGSWKRLSTHPHSPVSKQSLWTTRYMLVDGSFTNFWSRLCSRQWARSLPRSSSLHSAVWLIPELPSVGTVVKFTWLLVADWFLSSVQPSLMFSCRILCRAWSFVEFFVEELASRKSLYIISEQILLLTVWNFVESSSISIVRFWRSTSCNNYRNII